MADSRIAVIGILAILLVAVSAGLGAYYFQSNSVSKQNTLLSSLANNQNQEITQLSQQIISLEDNPSTTTSTDTIVSPIYYSTTLTEMETETTTSLATFVSTLNQTELMSVTETTTVSMFPPSNSSYILTFVEGNVSESSQYGILSDYAVNLTYEMHGPIPASLIVWVRYPNGGILQDSTPTIFKNQAYLTLNAGFETSSFPNLVAWVTDSSNNVLSPTANLTISQV